GGVAAVWLSYLLVRQSFGYGWWQLAVVVLFWVLLAYLVLPRLHRILTRIYVPEYFIGRARTSDGLLGDPINLALLGEEAQLHATMTAAGWTRADDLTFRTGWRIVRSTLTRRSYAEAPVSPLLLFGRLQDFAYQQEVDGSPGKRHHVRFWRCPDGWKLPGGHPTQWLAAGTYDRRVGLSLFTLQVTHKIAPDTDAERDHIVATIRAAEPAAEVHVIRDFSAGYHARNGGGDSIETDGDLPVLDLRAVRAPADDVEPTDSRDKRPAATVVATGFVAARVVEGAIGVVVLFTLAPSMAPDEQALFFGTGAVTVLLILLEALLAWRIFVGSNRARVLAMVLSTLAILGQAITVQVGGHHALAAANIPGVALDVLLVLALSSERALRYARRRRKTPKRISGLPGDAAPF
ncbi:MAG TPA: LssY C-terminal domain-containing protein, partial [Pseudolysinimonas sp.]|nr:LssY C-terminal domain-containing protein [Pseudolysinimonas sp.]